MNAYFLKGYMKEHGDDMAALAAALEIHPQTLYAKMNEVRGQQFNQGEIKAIVERYQLSPEDLTKIFFD